MSSAVATRSRTEVAQESAYDPFASAGNELGGSSAIYAKFNGNSGEMSYGSNATEIDEGEEMVADVAGARRGWICWKDEKVVDEVMVPIVQGPPPGKHELTDHGPYTEHDDGTKDGWSEQFAIDFRLLGEGHDGVQITYKTTTKSAFRPLGDLLKDYGRQYKNNPGALPIVKLEKGSYMPKEKKHGRKYFPKFPISDWINEDDLVAQYGDGRRTSEGDENSNIVEEPKAAPKQVTKATTKAETAKAETTAPEPEVDDEEAELLRKLEEKRAAKAAAAAAAEAPAEAPAETAKPVPAGERQARRRSF